MRGIIRVQGEVPPREEHEMAVTSVSPVSVGVQVGDFFVRSWGYDQTNVDFYQVVGLTPKGVKIQKWSSTWGDEGGSSVVPGEGPETEADWSACTPDMDYWERRQAQRIVPAKVQTKRLQSHGSGCYIPLTSYSSAYQWNGRSCYQTPAGMGH